MSGNTISASELLTHTTTRLEGKLPDGKVSVGTGFFYAFKIDGKDIPVIITNKHVIEDCNELIFTINELDENNQRSNTQHITTGFAKDALTNYVILHPDEDVDLCVIMFGPILNRLDKAEGKKYYLRWIDASLIPDENEWQSFSSLEEITMIGYPNGIWDKVNNLPVARRGITATHPKINYDGRSEFLIDTAVFPGSSGSPIYLFNQGSYATDKGITMGTRIKLLGINYAVYTHTAEGDITIKKTPTTSKPITETQVPNNLGIIIKSTKIIDFLPKIEEFIKKNELKKSNQR